MLTNRWMDKQIFLYSYNGLVLDSKKEWTTDTSNNTDEP